MRNLFKTERAASDGVLLLSESDLSLRWCGQGPAPRLSLLARIRIAMGYMQSNGHGPMFSRLSCRLIKAVISRWKSPQVQPWSGKPIETTGLSLAEEWTRFSLTGCGCPHTLQGTDDAISASRSSCD